MHVICDGWCARERVGSCGPSNSAKENERRLLDFSEGLIQSPWKSLPMMMR